jgi:ribose 5-phosphate isomerase B
MKIALSTDHAGFERTKTLKQYLEAQGHTCEYLGPEAYDPSDDYPDFIRPAAQAVASGACDTGIIFGASGQGEAIVANRVKGIRCGVYYGPAKATGSIDAEGNQPSDEYEILRLNRRHNDANMLSLAGRFLDEAQVQKAVDIWLNTPYNGEERHARRIAKIDQ